MHADPTDRAELKQSPADSRQLASDMDQQQASAGACAVPPGFRFHPTEEELVGYYLARKVASQKIDLDIIREVDLYRIEPWDLQERCSYYGGGGGQPADAAAAAAEEPTEYYFFSYKDRKYPSGTRTNRATAAGFWKATGRDKPVLSSSSSVGGGGRSSGAVTSVIGMRKTLVFYRGRAPNGRKTDWIIHEYRLQNNEHAPAQEEGWVVCRAFQKPMPNQQQRHHSYAAAAGYPPVGAAYATVPGAATYYYDGLGPAAANNNARGGLLMMTSAATAGADHHGLLAAAESKLQVHQLLADMPPLHSPAIDHHQRYDDDQAAAAAESSSTLDWNLLSSLLPSSAQLAGFHQQLPASPSSCSKNNSNI